MSCGPTPERASQALREAVALYLVTAEETGTLAEVLEEAGYESKGQRWISPTRQSAIHNPETSGRSRTSL